MLDLLVVGAGPAGLSASLEAMRHGLRFSTVEQNDVGGAIRQYPRRKLVMTQPMDIPIYGRIHKHEMLKEELVALWDDIIRRTGLTVRTQHKVENVVREDGVFVVHSTSGQIVARHVLLAIGRRGTPRKLGVPGEDLPKVAYSLLEPDQFQEMDLLVVGGGDSALEAACSLAEEPGTRVTLSYRRDRIARAREAVRERLQRLAERRKLNVALSSEVREIREGCVVLEQNGEVVELPNDQVFILAGGELPTAFLRQIGVSVETKFGQR